MIITKYIINKFDEVVGEVDIDESINRIAIGTYFAYNMHTNTYCDAVNCQNYKLSTAKKYKKQVERMLCDIGTVTCRENQSGVKNYAWKFCKN